MSSTASYFKDEAGVHLSLHLTPAEYREMTGSLLLNGSREAEAVRQLLARAKAHEETKVVEPRFELDAPPVGGV